MSVTNLSPIRSRLIAVSSPFCVIAFLLTAQAPLDAQFGRILRGAVEREAKDAVNDAVKDVVECASGDEKCAEDAEKDGKEVVVVDDPPPADPAESSPPPDDAGQSAGQPGEGVWRNYDFTPGKDVLYASDFTNERVGRFPTQQLGFGEGNAQIVELDGDKVLEVSASTVFTISLPKTLPDDFSLEFDVKTATQNMGLDVFFGPKLNGYRDYESQYLQFGAGPGIYHKGEALSSIHMNGGLSRQFYSVKLQVDGDYAVLYVDSERAANLPVAKFIGSDVITFHMGANTNYRGYIKNFVVAAGIETFYSTLTETGEFTTRGIYFDSGSDVIRPESTPTLEDIRSTLTSNTELKVTIEGHTDDRGEEDYNADLSERRAAAVVRYLTNNGVDQGQVTAVGKGETDPVADNQTAEGRAENRRVVVRHAG